MSNPWLLISLFDPEIEFVPRNLTLSAEYIFEVQDEDKVSRNSKLPLDKGALS